MGKAADTPHVPVLITPLIAACAPIKGHWIDGTLGAGGYARALLEAGADRVTGIDRDPLAIEMAASWAAPFGDRLTLVPGVFSKMDELADAADGVVLDLGVSSMQLDQARRGFSFMRDGPLDMRMSQDGMTAADLVNSVDEGELADILFLYGEERASRRIARAIIRKRAEVPIVSTLQLAEIIEGCLPRAKPGQAHPATRSFQAIRIAVNDEYAELIGGLEAAERALRPGGKLAVVTFNPAQVAAAVVVTRPSWRVLRRNSSRTAARPSRQTRPNWRAIRVRVRHGCGWARAPMHLRVSPTARRWACRS